MRLRDSEDRGFPSPLLLSYTTSSSFLSPIPCRSRCRWQGDADTSQSLPLSDERLLPPPRLTLLFNVCLTFLAVHFLLIFLFVLGSDSIDGLSLFLRQHFILFGTPLRPHPCQITRPLSLFLRMIEIVMVRECHDVGKSHDDCLSGVHWFNHYRQKQALLKAKMHRVQILWQYVSHSRNDKKAMLQVTFVPSLQSQQRKYFRRSNKEMLSVLLEKLKLNIKYLCWLLIFL